MEDGKRRCGQQGPVNHHHVTSRVHQCHLFPRSPTQSPSSLPRTTMQNVLLYALDIAAAVAVAPAVAMDALHEASQALWEADAAAAAAACRFQSAQSMPPM